LYLEFGSQVFTGDNHPSARAKPEGEGVVINHKSHGYSAVSTIYPTRLVWLAVLQANKLVVIEHKSHGYCAVSIIISYLIGPRIFQLLCSTKDNCTSLSF